MKNLNLLLLVSIFSLAGCGSTPQNKKIKVGQSTLALKDHQLLKNVKWSGVIVQTVNNKDNTCFQVVETQTYTDLKPKYKAIGDNSRFIVCKDGNMEAKEYDGRLITTTADIVSFYKSKSKEDPFEYAILNAHSIKLWDKQNHPKLESDAEKAFREFNLYTPPPRNIQRNNNSN